MQKAFLIISTLLSLFFIQIYSVRAQGQYARVNLNPKEIPKDSSNLLHKKDSTVELSPVAVPVALNEEAQAASIHYTPLQSSYFLTFSANLVSGNLNSEVVQFIKSYYYQNSNHFRSIQLKAEPCFPIIEKVFAQFGIPKDLKYLAVIESGLNTHARSNAGAVGAWQFMASTARLLGLQVNSHRDDRKNLYKSTVAAAKYLSKLYSSLDNWLLVIAAYNCGPEGVLNAIRASGSSNFWDLKKYLPHESQRHVMKFLATAYIMDRFADFFGVNKQDLNFQITAGNTNDNIPTADLAHLQVSGKYSLSIIAKYTGMDLAVLNKLNPGFEKSLSGASQSFMLNLPAAKMILFKANKNRILNESINLLMENNRLLTASASRDFPPVKRLPEQK